MDSVAMVVESQGRALDVRVSGPADGLPLVMHHGTPGANTATRMLDRSAHARGLRVVSVSRPGYGGSDRHAGRRVVDVVADTDAVLGALGATRCVVGGWSGGGPHALACAARLHSAEAAVIIAGLAPHDAAGLDWMAGMGDDNVVEFGAALQGEVTLRRLLDGLRPELEAVTVSEIVTSLDSLLPEVDRAVLTAEFGEDLAAGFHEALRAGVDGWLDDDLAFAHPWGFELSEITVPVMVWQGSADLMVPFSHGRWLASQITHATVHLEEGEGHLSIGVGAIDRILDELVRSAA